MHYSFQNTRCCSPYTSLYMSTNETVCPAYTHESQVHLALDLHPDKIARGRESEKWVSQLRYTPGIIIVKVVNTVCVCDAVCDCNQTE